MQVIIIKNASNKFFLQKNINSTCIALYILYNVGI